MEEEKKQSFKQSAWEFVKFFLIAALIVIPIRLWVAQPFIVSGASMLPNFENGEYLIIDEFSYHFREPQRGEVIIFRFPHDTSKFFIKRVIGLPNETIVIDNNQIFIYNEIHTNGMLIEENYLPGKISMNDQTTTLKENEFFVMGDNRQMSSDSRIWGALTENFIIGRAWLRLWPFTKLGIFP